MSKKLIIHSKGDTVDNIVDNIMAELFADENVDVKYWKHESGTTSDFLEIFKVENGVGYYYKAGVWQEHYDLTAKDKWATEYDSVPSDEIDTYIERVKKQEYYYNELGEKSPRRLNAIISLVQSRVPKEQANLNDEVEEWFYDGLEKEAQELYKKYGQFPVFDLYELD